jgi:CubicO group peptidase (beta-lactamase class C family)
MEGPTNEPGTEFLYSNPGYDLLAVVIERVSGMTYPEFMQSRIFDKLGMTHTFSLPNPQRRNGPMVAISYTLENEAPVAYPFDSLDNLVGSGSIYTTAGDMALYDEALYGDKLVSQPTLQDAFQPAQLKNGNSEPYGFGWELEEWNGESYSAHSGAWLGFQSDYVRFPERHFSVIVMLNRDYGIPDDEERIALQVAEFYLK